MGGYIKVEPSPLRRESEADTSHQVDALSFSTSREFGEGAAGTELSRRSPAHALTAQQSALDGRAIVQSHVSLQRALDRRASTSRPIVQRKIRSGAQVFDGTAAAASFGEPMHGLLTSNEIHVTNKDGGRSLEHGLRGPIKILSMHHHLIGEQHGSSRVASIEDDWAAAVPILYESLLPSLSGPSLKRPMHDAKEAPKAKPLEDIRVRAIHTIAHVSDLVAKAQKKLDPERQTLVSALAWLAETFDRYKRADFDAAAVLGDDSGAALAHGASVQKIRDHTKGLVGKLEQAAIQLRAGGNDLSPVTVLLSQLAPVKTMLLADVATDKPQSAVAGGNKPSQWDDASTAGPLFQDLKLDHAPTYEPHYKYNALREEHMVKAILASGRPSIAIMGQAHLRAIQSDWNDASFKFHTDVSAFNKAVTVMIPLAPKPAAQAAAPRAAGGDVKHNVSPPAVVGGNSGAAAAASAATSGGAVTQPAPAQQATTVQLAYRTNVGRSSAASQADVGSSVGARTIGGLPSALKAGIEHLSGLAMDDVRVHYNSSKPAAVQAHAYAQGTDIHLAPGQEKHLPHEAWHVVQQKQGRVKPTLQLKGLAINDDSGLEREADIWGARASRIGLQSLRAEAPSGEEHCAKCEASASRGPSAVQRIRIVWTADEIRRATNLDAKGVVETLTLGESDLERLLDELGKRGNQALIDEIKGQRSGREINPEKMFASDPPEGGAGGGAKGSAAATEADVKLESEIASIAEDSNAVALATVHLPPVMVPAKHLEEARRQLDLQLEALNSLTAKEWLLNTLINRMKTTEQLIAVRYGTVRGRRLGAKIDGLLQENHALAALVMVEIRRRMATINRTAPPEVKEVTQQIDAAAAAALGETEIYLAFQAYKGLDKMQLLSAAGLSGGIGRQHGEGDEKSFRETHQHGIDLLAKSNPAIFQENACLHNPDQCAGGPMLILWQVAHEQTLARLHAWYRRALDVFIRAEGLIESYNRSPPTTRDGQVDKGMILAAEDQQGIAEDECQQAMAAYMEELTKHLGHSGVNSLLGDNWMSAKGPAGAINRIDAILSAVLKIPLDQLATTPMNVITAVQPVGNLQTVRAPTTTFPDIVSRAPKTKDWAALAKQRKLRRAGQETRVRNAKKKQRRQQQQSFGLLAFRNAKRDADVKSSAATHSGATHSTSSSSSAATEDYAANFSWDEDESEGIDEMEIISEGDEEAEDEDMGEKEGSGGQ